MDTKSASLEISLKKQMQKLYSKKKTHVERERKRENWRRTEHERKKPNISNGSQKL